MKDIEKRLYDNLKSVKLTDKKKEKMTELLTNIKTELNNNFEIYFKELLKRLNNIDLKPISQECKIKENKEK